MRCQGWSVGQCITANDEEGRENDKSRCFVSKLNQGVLVAKIHPGQVPSQITQSEVTFIRKEFGVSSEPNVCVSHVVKTVVMSNWFAGR